MTAIEFFCLNTILILNRVYTTFYIPPKIKEYGQLIIAQTRFTSNHIIVYLFALFLILYTTDCIMYLPIIIFGFVINRLLDIYEKAIYLFFPFVLKIISFIESQNNKLSKGAVNLLAIIAGILFFIRSYFVENQQNKYIYFLWLLCFLMILNGLMHFIQQKWVPTVLLIFGFDMLNIDLLGSGFAGHMRDNPTSSLSMTYGTFVTKYKASPNVTKRYVVSHVVAGFVHGRTALFFTGKATVIVAGVTAGTTLISSHLERRHQSAEAEKNRQYQSAEAEKNRQFQSAEAERVWQRQTAEAEKNRAEAERVRQHERWKVESENAKKKSGW